MSTILVIDDEQSICEAVEHMLCAGGHAVRVAASARVGLDRLQSEPVDLVITDMLMPDQDGIETIAAIRRIHGRLPIVAMCGGGRLGAGEYLDMARQLGADATLIKPFGRQELLATVDALLAG
jgi:DNA-binding response OmpR family regulator